MEIEWSKQAVNELDAIYTSVLRFTCSENIAYGLYKIIVEGAIILETFPLAGPKEPLLKELPLDIRSIVVHQHYKLIYYADSKCVHIIDVWDCRKKPETLTYRLTE
ncbi:type II toxin-antitoxin system RelE/ParE family toxin [Bacteroides sp.]